MVTLEINLQGRIQGGRSKGAGGTRDLGAVRNRAREDPPPPGEVDSPFAAERDCSRMRVDVATRADVRGVPPREDPRVASVVPRADEEHEAVRVDVRDVAHSEAVLVRGDRLLAPQEPEGPREPARGAVRGDDDPGVERLRARAAAPSSAVSGDFGG